MPHPAGDTTAYTGNQADGDSTNIYGNVYGDVHFPGRSNGPGESISTRCLRDLRVTDPREDRARIEGDKDRLLRECYAWILEDASYKQWRTQNSARLLWIKGDPGKGKTMMTMGVIDELSRRDDVKPSPWAMSSVMASLGFGSAPYLLTYFFCQSTRPELNNAVSVLRGLIYLLILQREGLMRHVRKRYETVGRQMFEGPNAVYALRETLSDILTDAALPPMYLLVDALDECTSGLSELLYIMTDPRLGRRSRVKWLVTSRHVPEIERYLQPDSLGVKVSLEIKANFVSRAVAAFVEYKVQRLASVQKYNSVLQAEVQQQLCDKAEGTFLWVSLVCKELEAIPLYRTREVLQALQKGLDPLYDRMMAQILAQDARTVGFCKSILRAIALVFRPLKLSELAVAAGLPHDHFSNVQAVADLAGRCGSFLTVRESAVTFIHLSAKDYFTRGNRKLIIDGTPAEEHIWLIGHLLESMNSILHRDICNLQKPGARVKEAVATGCIRNSDLPQVAYACEYWVDHVQVGRQACRGILVDGGEVHNLLQKHLLHWLEAMSLLQRMPDALAAVYKLQLVVNGTDSLSLSSFLHDAVRFAMRSGLGIQEAPLQVYCSALVFAPKRSLIRRHFAREMPAWFNNTLGFDDDWGQLWQTIEGSAGAVTSVAFSSQGDRLASASNDKTVRVWGVQTGQLLRTLKGHTGHVTSVVFLAADDQLASASHDMTVRIWDAKTGQPLYLLEGHTKSVRSLAFAAVGDRLASGSSDHTVRVWNTKTKQLLHTFRDHTSSVTSVAFSAAGNQLASASLDETVRVWDAETGQLLHIFDHTGWVSSVAFSVVGDKLASASEDMVIRVWNAKSGRLMHMLRGHTMPINSLAFSPVDDRLASASEGGSVRVWGITTEQTLQSLEGHAASVSSVAFSQQGDWLASASTDRTVQIWDTKLAGTSRSNRSDENHTRYIYSMAFSPQGERLASASEDMTVRLWDAQTRQLLQTLRGHTSSVHGVAFSPTGDRLASASLDNTVRVWDVQTGQSLHTFEHTGRVSRVAFSGDGSHLETNQGSMLLPSSVSPESTLTHQPPAQRIFIRGRWLIVDSEDMLWIPAIFEPACTAIGSDQIAFGYSSGKVLLLLLS